MDSAKGKGRECGNQYSGSDAGHLFTLTRCGTAKRCRRYNVMRRASFLPEAVTLVRIIFKISGTFSAAPESIQQPVNPPAPNRPVTWGAAVVMPAAPYFFVDRVSRAATAALFEHKKSPGANPGFSLADMPMSGCRSSLITIA
jgi:hypothetical protein